MTTSDANATRQGTRLECDDEQFCKWCGTQLGETLANPPDWYPFDEPTDLCGNCEADRSVLVQSAVQEAEEQWGVDISSSDLPDPPADWDLSTELWYDWSASVQAQYAAEVDDAE